MPRPKYWWYHYAKESIMRNMSGTAPLKDREMEGIKEPSCYQDGPVLYTR